MPRNSTRLRRRAYAHTHVSWCVDGSTVHPEPAPGSVSTQYAGAGLHGPSTHPVVPLKHAPGLLPKGHSPESGNGVHCGAGPPQHGFMQNCFALHVFVPHANGPLVGEMTSPDASRMAPSPAPSRDASLLDASRRSPPSSGSIEPGPPLEHAPAPATTMLARHTSPVRRDERATVDRSMRCASAVFVPHRNARGTANVVCRFGPRERTVSGRCLMGPCDGARALHRFVGFVISAGRTYSGSSSASSDGGSRAPTAAIARA